MLELFTSSMAPKLFDGLSRSVHWDEKLKSTACSRKAKEAKLGAAGSLEVKGEEELRVRLKELELAAQAREVCEKMTRDDTRRLRAVKRELSVLRKLLQITKRVRGQGRGFGVYEKVLAKYCRIVEKRLRRQLLVKGSEPWDGASVQDEVTVKSVTSPLEEAGEVHVQHDHSYCRCQPTTPGTVQPPSSGAASTTRGDLRQAHEELRVLLEECEVDMVELPEITRNEIQEIGAGDVECFREMIRNWDVPADLEPEESPSCQITGLISRGIFTSAGSTETYLSASGASHPLEPHQPPIMHVLSKPCEAGLAWCTTVWNSVCMTSVGIGESLPISWTSSAVARGTQLTAPLDAQTSSAGEIDSAYDALLIKCAKALIENYPEVTIDMLSQMSERCESLPGEKYIPRQKGGKTTQPSAKQDIVQKPEFFTGDAAIIALNAAEQPSTKCHCSLPCESEARTRATSLSSELTADHLGVQCSSPQSPDRRPSTPLDTPLSRKRRKAEAQGRPQTPVKRFNRTRMVEEATPPPSPTPSIPCARTSPTLKTGSKASRSPQQYFVLHRLCFSPQPARSRSPSCDSICSSEDEEDEEPLTRTRLQAEHDEPKTFHFREFNDSTEKDSIFSSDDEDTVTSVTDDRVHVRRWVEVSLSTHDDERGQRLSQTKLPLNKVNMPLHHDDWVLGCTSHEGSVSSGSQDLHTMDCGQCSLPLSVHNEGMQDFMLQDKICNPCCGQLRLTSSTLTESPLNTHSDLRCV